MVSYKALNTPYKSPNVCVVVTTRRQIPSANNIQFIRGNAHNETFLKSILSSKD